MFKSAKKGDRVLVEITVNGTTTLSLGFVSQLFGHSLVVRDRSFDRATGLERQNRRSHGHARLLPATPENLRLLEEQESKRKKTATPAAANEKQRRKDALAAASWLRKQKPEVIIRYLGVTALAELADQVCLDKGS